MQFCSQVQTLERGFIKSVADFPSNCKEGKTRCDVLLFGVFTFLVCMYEAGIATLEPQKTILF